MQLSLLVTYRKRETHLKTQIAWWRKQVKQGFFQNCEVLLIEVDENSSSRIRDAIEDLPIRYVHCPCPGIFHKTKALNLGLSMAKGQWIAPFDVDLIPVGNTLLHQLEIATQSPKILATGYRVLSPAETLEIDAISTTLENCTIAPEDMPTALWKHLVRHEKFGVVPFFQRKKLDEIGGWDEQFVGWGAEDQDLIERYLQKGYTLCRCPELVYIHLSHEREIQWTEPFLVKQNRNYYYRKVHDDA